MGITHRLTISAGAGALAILLGGTALAALTSTQQKCLDCYNNKLRLVGQQAGKDYRKVIQSAGKNKAPYNVGVNAHITNDTPGKIAGKQQKVTDCYATKCNGTEPIQQGAATANTAMVDWAQELIHEVFGDPILDGTVVNPGKDIAKCQDKAYQRSEQLFTVKLKEMRKCKKDAMRAGTVTDSVTLAAVCMSDPQPFAIPDPKGKQAKKAQKLTDDVNANCDPPVGPPYTTIFPGDCSGSPSAALLGACLERLVECKVCKALNAVDGMSVNCDIFDDGVANGSCGIPLHKCTLGGGMANSYVNIYSAAFPVPIAFDTSGSTLDIGGAGNASQCQVQNFNPINIIAIGFVCIQPGAGCPDGTRYCGPGAPGSGPALGVDSLADGFVGACTNNADCTAQCVTACPTQYGVGFVPLTSQCTGFCTEGAQGACTTDAQCLGLGQGSCNGPDNPGANANKCQCSCLKSDAFGGSDPGDLQCNLSADLKVEMAAPCNGTDVLINVGNACIPVGSQRAHGRIDDANFILGSTVPGPPQSPNANDQTGLPLACATMDASTTAGFAGVGTVNFFGSTIGDLSVGLKASCM